MMYFFKIEIKSGGFRMHKTLVQIFKVSFFILMITLFTIIGLRSCLLKETKEEYVIYNEVVLQKINKAKENLTANEIREADEIWFEIEDILESHMSKAERDVWFNWMLTPPKNEEEKSQYVDFYNSVWKRLTKKEKEKCYRLEKKLIQALKIK